MGKSLTSDLVIAKSKCDNLYSVKNLNLWGNDIDDMGLLKNMPNVEVLSLSVNKISSLKDFQYCHKLQELYLRKNNIQDIREIQYLANLKNLKVLWLWDNPVAETPNYREIVIKVLPNLTKLDNSPVTADEISSSQGIQLNWDFFENNSNSQQNPILYQQQNQQQQSLQIQQIETHKDQNHGLSENKNAINIQQSHQMMPGSQKKITAQKKQNAENVMPASIVGTNISNNSNLNQYQSNVSTQQEKKNCKENILCAVMTLIKELDTPQLELLKREVEKKLFKE